MSVEMLNRNCGRGLAKGKVDTRIIDDKRLQAERGHRTRAGRGLRGNGRWRQTAHIERDRVDIELEHGAELLQARECEETKVDTPHLGDRRPIPDDESFHM